MSIGKTALRIVAGHRGLIAVYLVLLSLFMLGASAAQAGSSQASEDGRPAFALIDRDSSAISHGIARSLAGEADRLELADEGRAAQDALAKGQAALVVIVPEGYGDALARSARDGSEPPALEVSEGYLSADGALLSVRLRSYLQQISAGLAANGGNLEAAVQAADEASSEKAEVRQSADSHGAGSGGMSYFALFAGYPVFLYASIAIASLMEALNRRTTRLRLGAAPVRGLSRGLQVLGACVLTGLVGWAWICALGGTAFGSELLDGATGGWAGLALIALSLLAYMLNAVAVGFLLGQLGVATNAAHAIANTAGMTMSFISGAWTSDELLPGFLIDASRLTPARWSIDAIRGAIDLPSADWQSVAPLLADCGVCALFAVAIALAAVAIGAARSREA